MFRIAESSRLFHYFTPSSRKQMPYKCLSHDHRIGPFSFYFNFFVVSDFPFSIVHEQKLYKHGLYVEYMKLYTPRAKYSCMYSRCTGYNIYPTVFPRYNRGLPDTGAH